MLLAPVLLLVAASSPSPVFPSAIDASISMIRARSGPSARFVDGKFVLDAVRNRFEYPEDKSLIVYFECRAPEGEHTLSVRWKNSQGNTVAASQNLKMEARGGELNSYWSLSLAPGQENGAWSCELLVDGNSIGRYAFEIAFPRQVQAPPEPEPPTFEEMESSLSKPLVWIHKLDEFGIRVDTSSGFIIAPDAVLTALQSIDMATSLEVEFFDGRVVPTDEIIACNRLEDWALVKAATGNLPPLKPGARDSVVVGEPLMVFETDTERKRALGSVDIKGKSAVPGLGERISFDPQPSLVAAGGPLLNLNGEAVGILGGSLMPGLQVDHRKQTIDAAIADVDNYRMYATPLEGIPPQVESPPKTIGQYLASGMLTPPLKKNPAFQYADMTTKLSSDSIYHALREGRKIDREESLIVIFTEWQRADGIDRGTVSIRVYDVENRLMQIGKPIEITLPANTPVQLGYPFNPASFRKDRYRIDVLWNGSPVWRTYISLLE